MPPAVDDNDGEECYYDGTKLAVVPFLSRLPDFCRGANSSVDRLVRNGTTSNSKGQTCVHNAAHAYMLENLALMTTGTWSKPFPIKGPTLLQTNACIMHAEQQRISLLA